METRELVSKFKEIQHNISAYGYALGVLSYDANTAAPVKSAAPRGETMGLLTRALYDLQTGDETKELLYALKERAPELDGRTARELELALEGYERISCIPADEYVASAQLTNESEAVWHQAKPANDFAAFAPYLEKLSDYSRRFAKYYAPDSDAYGVMIDEYEKDMTLPALEKFFETVKEGLVPLIHRISESGVQPDDSFLRGDFPVARQKELSAYLMKVLTVDPERCVIGETEHPFTDGLSTDDVRITTHYFPDNFASSMFSVIHESGHALYELCGNPDFNGTLLHGGVSMGIHESQSRFFENIVGRSRGFISFIMPKLRELFPSLEGVSAEQMYRAINVVRPSLIRTEADELTYPLHIMVRYELEKSLISGELKVQDVPARWNELYREYLGVEVPDDRRGCLQDSHWSSGAFGYFPSYALGSAYGAQMLTSLKKDVDFDGCVASGRLAPIVGWLTDRIYKHQSLLTPAEIIRNACGADFDATFYVDYMKAKYSELYGLN